MKWMGLLKYLPTILVPLLNNLSPVIRDLLEGFIKDLYQKALETDSPWDDFFVGLLAELLEIEVGGQE